MNSATITEAATRRAAILHASAAWGTDEDGHLMNMLVDVIKAQAAEIAGLREAIAGPESWLDSWAKHVGNCQGGYVCTCGLTLARTELSAALAQVTS